VTIVSYTSSGVNKLKASLNDDAKVVIYDRHMFIIQASDFHFWMKNSNNGSITAVDYKNWRYDIQHNDIYPKDIQHTDTQHNVMTSKMTLDAENHTVMLGVIMLSVFVMSAIMLNVIIY
jgi:hypothetical protein